MDRIGEGQRRAELRHVTMAAFVGSLAPASAAAAFGWQGAVLAFPVLALMGWGTAHLAGCASRRKAERGVMRVALSVWGTLLLSRWLSRCGRRLELTGGGEPGTAWWIVVLVAAFLLWVACRRGPVLLRTAPLFAWLMLALVGAVLLWGAGRVRWAYVAMPPVDLWRGFWAALETGAVLLFLLPYIYKETIGRKETDRGGGWVVLAALAPTLLAGVTAGVLSPAVVALAKEPFFAMTASLGNSFRVEGLISALWLVPDVVGMGLLARVGAAEKKIGPILALILAAIGSVWNIFESIPGWIWGCGTVVLWCACAAPRWKTEENCG